MSESDDVFQAFGRPEVPEHCPQEDRACRYDRERSELMLALRDLRKAIDAQGVVIAALREDLARGSEKFRRSDETSAELHTVRALLDKEKAERMASEQTIHRDLAKINESLSLIRNSQQQVSRIVYGACGFVLISVLGALLTLVLVKGAG